MSPVERNQLIDDLIDQDISEADFLRLEADLSVDPIARAAYYERLQLSLALAEEAAVRPESKAPLPASSRRALVWLAMAALWLAFIGVTSVWLWPRQRAGLAGVESTANGHAALVTQIDAVWSGMTAPLTDGALLPPGVIHLESGLAQIELFSGVRLVVEGEAKFEILSSMEMRLARGRLRAHVPEAAHGFRIHTSEGEIVDLGTEFAVDAAGERAELHVLDGEVEWHPKAAGMLRLVGGEALGLAPGNDPTQMPADDSRFVGLSEINERQKATQETRRKAWLQFSEGLRRDPRLIAAYRMDVPNPGERLVPNLAASGMVKPGAGAIVAAKRVEGRWGQTEGALDFSPAGSRVRVNIPGRHSSLTLLCWVKINSLDRLYNSLFLTDGHEVGAPHWQIMNDGRLFFSVKRSDGHGTTAGGQDKYNFYSPPFWTPLLSGRWILLGAVYDIEAKTVTHFLNGSPLASEAIPEEFLVENVTIGNASIANWSEPAYRRDAEFAVRNLNGSMDEFLLYSAALSAAEIAEIFNQSRP